MEHPIERNWDRTKTNQVRRPIGARVPSQLVLTHRLKRGLLLLLHTGVCLGVSQCVCVSVCVWVGGRVCTSSTAPAIPLAHWNATRRWIFFLQFHLRPLPFFPFLFSVHFLFLLLLLLLLLLLISSFPLYTDFILRLFRDLYHIFITIPAESLSGIRRNGNGRFFCTNPYDSRPFFPRVSGRGLPVSSITIFASCHSATILFGPFHSACRKASVKFLEDSPSSWRFSRDQSSNLSSLLTIPSGRETWISLGKQKKTTNSLVNPIGYRWFFLLALLLFPRLLLGFFQLEINQTRHVSNIQFKVAIINWLIDWCSQLQSISEQFNANRDDPIGVEVLKRPPDCAARQSWFDLFLDWFQFNGTQPKWISLKVGSDERHFDRRWRQSYDWEVRLS